MRFAYWIPKATNTHSEHEILIAFHGNNGYANETPCYFYAYIVCHVEQLKSVSDTLKFSQLFQLLDVFGY